MLTADDQAAFRGAARAVIEATPGFAFAGEVTSGEEAIAFASHAEPDLVLMDVHMPGLGGVEATRRLLLRFPRVIVLLVSVDGSAALSRPAQECGAVGVVDKQVFGPRLLQRVWRKHAPA